VPESVWQEISGLFAAHGSAVHENARCRAFLLDILPENKSEVFLLVTAVRQGVVSSLLSDSETANPSTGIWRETHRLIRNCALRLREAKWAVETWALALGVVSPKDLQGPQPVLGRVDPDLESSVETTLRDLVLIMGPTITDEPRRLGALLNDLESANAVEVFLLRSVLEMGFVRDVDRAVRSGKENIPDSIVDEVVEVLGLRKSAARWALDTWGCALRTQAFPTKHPSLDRSRRYYLLDSTVVDGKRYAVALGEGQHEAVLCGVEHNGISPVLVPVVDIDEWRRVAPLWVAPRT